MLCRVGIERFGYFIESVLLRRREIQKAVNFADVWYWSTVQGTSSVNYLPFDGITSLLIKSCENNFGKKGKIMKVEIRKSLKRVLYFECLLLWKESLQKARERNGTSPPQDNQNSKTKS